MGYSSPSIWPLFLLGQFVTLSGFGVTLYLQQVDRAALRDLQFRLELQASKVRELDWKQGQAKSSGGAGGDPEGEVPTTVRGEIKKPKTSSQFSNTSEGDNSPSKLVSVVFGLVGLVCFAATLCCWWNHWREQRPVLVGSPVERQRELAHRQLAELRLKKHGFGQ